MATWRGKTRGGLLGYKIFFNTLNYFGLRPAYFLLRFVAAYYFLFAWKPNRHTYYYFRHILHYSRLKAARSIYLNYCIFGEILIDKVAATAGLSSKFTFLMEGEEELKKMKHGGLMISAHIGNWEMAGNMLERVNIAFNIVMFDEEHKKIRDYLEEVMKEKNMHIIPIRDDLSHLIAIRNALENKEIVVIHGDRYLEGMKTITGRFMGYEARFPEGPFYLALRLNAPVSFTFAMKEGKTHYHFFATPAKIYAISPGERISEQHLQIILNDYLKEFEDKLRKYPLQWLNYYRFWKEMSE